VTAMPDRTTLNIDKEEHKATREVKNEYNESWTDVLKFYRNHRHELSLDGDGMQELDIDTGAIVEELQQELSMANEPGGEGDTREVINRIDDLETELKTILEGLQR